MAIRRLCFDGKETWLTQYNASYGPGDLWGCIGRWYSGRWHDAGAEQYIPKVQAALAAKVWTTWK
jgi:autotransporter family porin